MKSFFNLMGIKYEFEEQPGTVNPHAGSILAVERCFDYGKIIRLKEGNGCSGFYCEFYFDANGKFLHHGIWE